MSPIKRVNWSEIFQMSIHNPALGKTAKDRGKSVGEILNETTIMKEQVCLFVLLILLDKTTLQYFFFVTDLLCVAARFFEFNFVTNQPEMEAKICLSWWTLIGQLDKSWEGLSIVTECSGSRNWCHATQRSPVAWHPKKLLRRRLRFT